MSDFKVIIGQVHSALLVIGFHLNLLHLTHSFSMSTSLILNIPTQYLIPFSLSLSISVLPPCSFFISISSSLFYTSCISVFLLFVLLFPRCPHEFAKLFSLLSFSHISVFSSCCSLFCFFCLSSLWILPLSSFSFSSLTLSFSSPYFHANFTKK